MCPREVEGNGFIICYKLVDSEGGTGSFKGIKRFPSCFDFVRTFLVNEEVAFLAIDPILEKFFYFPLFLS